MFFKWGYGLSLICRVLYSSERGNFAKRQLHKIYILCKAGHFRLVLIIDNYRTYISISDYQLKNYRTFNFSPPMAHFRFSKNYRIHHRVPHKERLSDLTIGLSKHYRTKANYLLLGPSKSLCFLLFHKLKTRNYIKYDAS